MSQSIANSAELRAAFSSEVESQVRQAAAGLDPATIDEIVQLILQYGPSIWTAVTNLFHVTPKS